MADDTWFGVRQVFHDRNRRLFEERVVIWQAASEDEALEFAMEDARRYASEEPGIVALDLLQVFELFQPPGNGAEVFSLMRESELEPARYLDRFFDTGAERERKLP